MAVMSLHDTKATRLMARTLWSKKIMQCMRGKAVRAVLYCEVQWGEEAGLELLYMRRERLGVS